MKKYVVKAPYVVFSVRNEDGKKQEYCLKQGDTVKLPEADLSVKVMVFRRQIMEVTEPETAETEKNTGRYETENDVSEKPATKVKPTKK